jgi:hypothetical protein
MSDEYGFKALISNALSEQAERFRPEIATGVSPEREEEILVWFALQEMQERLKKARAITQERDPLVDLPLPRLLS